MSATVVAAGASALPVVAAMMMMTPVKVKVMADLVATGMVLMAMS